MREGVEEHYTFSKPKSYKFKLLGTLVIQHIVSTPNVSVEIIVSKTFNLNLRLLEKFKISMNKYISFN